MNIKLNYVEKGSGMPLVLLHGNGESSECFSAQIPVFSKKYRVIAVDTRGHGKSPRGDKPFTLAQFAEDLKNLLDNLELKKIYLLGFSDGGNIAITFMLKYPQYVEKLILNGANMTPNGVVPEVKRMFMKDWRKASVAAFFGRGDKRKKELLDLMVKEPHFTKEQLSAITVPTLVLVGNKDMITESETDTIASSIPNSTKRVLEGTHFIVSENSDEYNMVVLDFLEDE